MYIWLAAYLLCRHWIKSNNVFVYFMHTYLDLRIVIIVITRGIIVLGN